MNDVVSGNRADRTYLARLGERTMTKALRYARKGSSADDSTTPLQLKLGSHVGLIVHYVTTDPPFDEARTFDRIRRLVRELDHFAEPTDDDTHRGSVPAAHP